jgi:hypothetical protein
MVLGLRNVRLSTVLTAVAVIVVLLLPLTNINVNNVLLQSQPAFAQVQEEGEGAVGTTNATTTISNDTTTTTEPTAFLPYNNPIHGIFIQYPSDWTASTSGLADYTDAIAFYSPLQNVSDSFPASLTISVITYGQNISLSEYTNFIWTILNQSEGVIDVKSSSSEVTLAGHPAYRVVLASQPFENSTLIVNQMNTWTTIGNKVYTLNYEGEESTFNRYMPEVSQMLETLRLGISNITTATTGENQ